MKTSFLYIILLLLPLTLFAQKKKKKSYYATGAIGYSIDFKQDPCIPTSNVIYTHNPSGEGGGVSSYQYVGKPELANGITGGAAFGYSKKQFELELNMNYLHGFNVIRTYREDSMGETVLLHVHDLSLRLLRISTVFKVKTNGKRFVMSAGAGPLLGLVNQYNYASYDLINTARESLSFKGRFRTSVGLSLGARAEATGRYKLNKHYSIFSSLVYVYQAHASFGGVSTIKENGKTISRNRSFGWQPTMRYYNSAIIEAGVRYNL